MSELPVTFPPGTWVGDAAAQAAQQANSTDTKVDAEFNGTPMVALPGDTGRAVEERWHYERTLYQLKTGVLKVSDL